MFRFKAEVAWNGEAVVARYLDRWAAGGGDDRVPGHIQKAPILHYGTCITTPPSPCAAQLSSPPAAPAFLATFSGRITDRCTSAQRPNRQLSSRCGRERLLGQLQAGAAAGDRTALEALLRAYGRDLVSAVGAEVDRIEGNIQRMNPGILWVRGGGGRGCGGCGRRGRDGAVEVGTCRECWQSVCTGAGAGVGTRNPLRLSPELIAVCRRQLLCAGWYPAAKCIVNGSEHGTSCVDGFGP